MSNLSDLNRIAVALEKLAMLNSIKLRYELDGDYLGALERLKVINKNIHEHNAFIEETHKSYKP